MVEVQPSMQTRLVEAATFPNRVGGANSIKALIANGYYATDAPAAGIVRVTHWQDGEFFARAIGFSVGEGETAIRATVFQPLKRGFRNPGAVPTVIIGE